MSLFGEFAEQAIGAALGGQGNTQQNQVVQALLQAISNHQGGLPGLLQEFESAGLAQHVASWVGNGENLPISADQLHQVLGSSAISGIAAKLGIDPNQAAALAAQVLPHLVDKLTPAGAVTAEHSSAEGLLALAGQFFKS